MRKATHLALLALVLFTSVNLSAQKSSKIKDYYIPQHPLEAGGVPDSIVVDYETWRKIGNEWEISETQKRTKIELLDKKNRLVKIAEYTKVNDNETERTVLYQYDEKGMVCKIENRLTNPNFPSDLIYTDSLLAYDDFEIQFQYRSTVPDYSEVGWRIETMFKNSVMDPTTGSIKELLRYESEDTTNYLSMKILHKGLLPIETIHYRLDTKPRTANEKMSRQAVDMPMIEENSIYNEKNMPIKDIAYMYNSDGEIEMQLRTTFEYIETDKKGNWIENKSTYYEADDKEPYEFVIGKRTIYYRK